MEEKKIELEELVKVVGGGTAEFEQYLAEMCKKYNTSREKVLVFMTAAEREQAKTLLAL